MSISIKDLEEDESRIDNLLNKILRSSRLIEELNNQIGSIKKIKILIRLCKVQLIRLISLKMGLMLHSR